MQIINTIEIICSKCGKPMTTELSVGREYNPDKWIFKVMPCTLTAKAGVIALFRGLRYFTGLNVNITNNLPSVMADGFKHFDD